MFVCLSVCQSVCLSVGMSVCLSVGLSVCLSVSRYVCLSVCLSVRGQKSNQLKYAVIHSKNVSITTFEVLFEGYVADHNNYTCTYNL